MKNQKLQRKIKTKTKEESSDDEDDFDIKPREIIRDGKESAKVQGIGYRLKDSAKSAMKTHQAEPSKYKTEQEVVGKFIHIYRVNLTTGERTMIRRIPNRTALFT
eukprot:UN04273